MTDLDETLRAWGESARASAPPTSVPLERLRSRRPGAALAIAASILVVAVVATVIAVVRARHTPAPAPVLHSQDYNALIVHDGDTVRLSGTVISTPGRPVRACAPFPENSPEPSIAYCRSGVDLVGVDLDRLTHRRVEGRNIGGEAGIVGIYHAGTTPSVTVTRQGAPVPDTATRRLTDPPCQAPPGGWPIGAANAKPDVSAIERYGDAHPGSIVLPVYARPSPRQVVVVVLVAGDPGPVDAALRPTYGKRLCVVHSVHTMDEVQRAESRFGAAIQPPVVTILRPLSVGSDGQLHSVAQLTQVSAAVARAALAQPKGILVLDPWLRPADS